MDDMAQFLEECFQRDRRGYPPVDLEAIRQGRLPAPPPEVQPVTWDPGGTAHASPGARMGLGRSAVFTVRLARDDLAVLERRAQLAGTTPSALARNLINSGLRQDDGTDELTEAVRRVEDAAAQLRAAAGL